MQRVPLRAQGRFALALCAAVFGCGGGDAQPPAEGAAPAAQTAAASPTPPEAPAPAATPPVDLLHAVDSAIAVSSVYRGRAEYVGRLVDGDLETAWNSASGERLGSFVEVRLPAQVEVTGIALTVGFTRATDRSDLFTGNLRITEVRVLRDGTPVGTYPLDPATRGLQTIPVTGAGGTYRIEVTKLLDGSHADWLETCISELQVLGRSPLAHPGERTPRLSVGTLPPPPAPVDPAAFAARFGQVVAAFERSFKGYEWSASRGEQDTGGPDPLSDRAAEFRPQLDGLVRRLATAIEPVDGLAADRVRRLLVEPVDLRGPARGAQLTTMIEALRSVAAGLPDAGARCAVERTHANLRFERIAAQQELDRYFAEVDESMGGGGSRRGNPTANTAAGAPETLRESTRLVNQARTLFGRTPNAVLATLEGHPVERVSPEVPPLLEALRGMRTHCAE